MNIVHGSFLSIYSRIALYVSLAVIAGFFIMEKSQESVFIPPPSVSYAEASPTTCTEGRIFCFRTGSEAAKWYTGAGNSKYDVFPDGPQYTVRDLTMEVWVKVAGTPPHPNSALLLGRTDGGSATRGDYWLSLTKDLRPAAGILTNTSGWGEGVVAPAPLPRDDQFHQIVMTYSSALGFLKLYVDGNPVGTKRNVPGTLGAPPSQNPTRNGISIGSLYNPSLQRDYGYYFIGEIREAGIYPQWKNDDQVRYGLFFPHRELATVGPTTSTASVAPTLTSPGLSYSGNSALLTWSKPLSTSKAVRYWQVQRSATPTEPIGWVSNCALQSTGTGGIYVATQEPSGSEAPSNWNNCNFTPEENMDAISLPLSYRSSYYRVRAIYTDRTSSGWSNPWVPVGRIRG